VDAFSVWVIAHSGKFEAGCAIWVVPTGNIGVVDDGLTRGLVGTVHNFNHLNPLPSGVPAMGVLIPLLTIVMPNVDIPTREFTQGIPGVPGLFEWFGIQFKGRIQIATSGIYTFSLNSDDGANLYIDGQLVVNNDGIHPTQERSGQATLSAGLHTVQIDYLQGPRTAIALQFKWDPTGGIHLVPVPASVLYRPL
jgi:hypothetical protein